MTDMKVKIGNAVLNTPVIGASGTSGWGEEIFKYNDPASIGGFVTKSVTLNKKTGNEGRRICETASGMLNSIGLENEGLDYFIENRADKYRELECAVFVNLAPYSRKELDTMIERLNQFKHITGYEINISCPNVELGGISFNASLEKAHELIKRIRKTTEKTIMLKLSPSIEASYDIAKAAAEEGFDAVTFTNTYVGTAIDIEKKEFIFRNRKAGLSGPAIKPLSLWHVYNMSKQTDIPIIGVGGIRTWRDALEYIMAGAYAVQIGTGMLIEPGILESIGKGISEYMKKNGIENISSLRGILN